MALRERRDVLQSIGLVLPISTTGCLGLRDRDSIEIEYLLYDPVPGELVPPRDQEWSGDWTEKLLDALGRDEETWVQVRININSGEIESSDLFRNTQVKANGYTGSMVGLSTIVPINKEPITSAEETFMLEEGMLVFLYYHIDHAVEQVEWLTAGLESELDGITLVDGTP